ncbi:MAG: sigma 54 modulation/S30EA ribosomal C-terminal domain-containing protein, partial [Pseudomonadota bacterium]
EAVMQLDLTDEAVLLFRNAGTGALNVVYRRTDGHIGWIDPAEKQGAN